MTGAISVPVTAASVAEGGTGQRRGEAAGISWGGRVFKRCSKKGDVPPLWVSEGRHNPLPHVSPFITALNWLYGKTILLSTDLVAELRELQAWSGLV
jgi:hypothetical protein